LGPNGAGKTTTMRMLTGFIPADAGQVAVEGFDIEEQALQAKARIGYLPELPPLYGEMTGADYLRFVGRVKGLPEASVEEACQYALTLAHAQEAADRPVGKLSKGFRQRVGLAAALVHRPTVLILDEPTAGLDPQQIAETREVIRELSGECTILLSSHILSEVESICGRILMIHQGRLIADASTQDLLSRQVSAKISVQLPATELDRALTTLVFAFPEAVIAIESGHLIVRAGLDRRSEVARVLMQAGFHLLGLSADESLEEVFLALTNPEVEA